MPKFSNLTIFALNLIVLTGALVFTLRSRLTRNAGPDIIIPLVFSSIFHALGWFITLLELDTPRAGRSLVVAASVLNASVLLQLIFGGSGGPIWSYLFKGGCLAEVMVIAYLVLCGEPTHTVGPVRKPVHQGLQDVERELERIEKRLIKLKGLANGKPAEKSLEDDTPI